MSYFDGTKCRWVTETDSCDDAVTDSNDDDNDGNDDTETDSDTIDGDTNSNDSNGADSNDESNNTSGNTSYQNLVCEPLDGSWMCSSGSKNHSLCIKFCSIDLDLSNTSVMWSEQTYRLKR